MKIRLILVGRSERGFVTEGIMHYTHRLARTFPVEQVVLQESGKGDMAYQQRTESERILAAFRPGEKVVVLDEKGKTLTSSQFAGQIGGWRDQGVRQVAFVIGGAYGFTDEVRKRADLIMSLSAMTFPHQLVRVLFAEQLYRAFSILGGSPYHHE
ncbi:MAG: 23S rRNA (pseudouridine(1915)-N(3))-methyltransferase RlmH [Flavobacteriales bacterium]|nr:23S rRNA (pseudouridine(1915)-N(3))-methyltransferase RlmH [Flavobacteriales bacterium]